MRSNGTKNNFSTNFVATLAYTFETEHSVKVLVVEDNKQLIEDLSEFLTINGFIVEQAQTYGEAIDKTAIYQYDVVLIDLGLPDGNGLDLIPIIRQDRPDTSILILTANDGIDYKVKALEWGADDYLTKPFHKAELNARIHSILRRKLGTQENTLTIGSITVDLSGREARANKKLLRLTRKEFDLLLFLIYNKNRLVTREGIAEHLWGDHIDQADNFDFIYNHIKNLRRKIVKAGAYDPIQSMYGMGYKFITEE